MIILNGDVMKYGTFVGLILTILGTILGVVGFTMLQSTGSTLKILFAGPTIAAVGIAMVIFPGADISLKEATEDKTLQRKFFSMSPKLHITFWVIFGAIALTISLVYLFR